jgi:hypothetical protein
MSRLIRISPAVRLAAAKSQMSKKPQIGPWCPKCGCIAGLTVEVCVCPK